MRLAVRLAQPTLDHLAARLSVQLLPSFLFLLLFLLLHKRGVPSPHPLSLEPPAPRSPTPCLIHTLFRLSAAYGWSDNVVFALPFPTRPFAFCSTRSLSLSDAHPVRLPCALGALVPTWPSLLLPSFLQPARFPHACSPSAFLDCDARKRADENRLPDECGRNARAVSGPPEASSFSAACPVRNGAFAAALAPGFLYTRGEIRTKRLTTRAALQRAIRGGERLDFCKDFLHALWLTQAG